MKKRSSKKGNGAKAAKSTKIVKTEKASGGLIPLKKICSELGLDPKASRVRLRRAWRRVDSDTKKLEGNVAFHEKGSRWDLTKSEAAEVRAILAG